MNCLGVLDGSRCGDTVLTGAEFRRSGPAVGMAADRGGEQVEAVRACCGMPEFFGMPLEERQQVAVVQGEP